MRALLVSMVGFVALAGCAVQSNNGPEDEDPNVELEAPFTSDVATLLDFELDGELLTSNATNVKSQVRAQMLFTVGQINGEKGVARLDRLTVTSSSVTAIGSGLSRIKYHAKLPIAWASKTDLPTSYTLVLPRRVDASGVQTFLGRYGKTCNDGEDDAVDTANIWYHYRPNAYGCSLADADVVRANAKVTVSTQNTVAKYPEYHKVWEDGALTVLAVFGKYEESATTDSDAGIAAYHEFLAAMRTELPGVVETGGGADVTFESDLGGGKRAQVVALLVDKVTTAPASFDARYSELSPSADVIVYNGHAGLGANVRSLSAKGRFFPGKYQIFFMDGCDTFAYVDGALASVRAPLNPDDPSGTKYMDIVTNAMPAYFASMSGDTVALLRALAHPEAPLSYGTIFRQVDPAQVVVVTGEEDNVYSKSYVPKSSWAGFHVSGEVGKAEQIAYETDVLPAGKYTFAMTPDGASPGGDADLYVRVGSAPTATSTYKCKSYLYNSNERCTVTLTAPSKVKMIARGDSVKRAPFHVDGFAY
ncbi:MAG: hypothetical protein ACXVEE_03505 [Polyangiales bacterium]